VSKKRYLNARNEEIYKKYKQDNGEDFIRTRNGRYRISDELYEKLFNNELDVPEGHKISGKSTLYDDKGTRLLQWVKTSEDKERRDQIIKAIIDGMNSKIKKASPAIQNEKRLYRQEIINQYTITDYHLGMMAWHEESGADWDMKIAEELILNWFQQAIESSPQSENCVFAQIGDFLHWDGLDAVTPTSRNLLDADTRFTKLVRTAIRILRQIINMLLEKYNHVYCIMAEGNHDLASSIWLRETFSYFYENEPRLSIDTSPDPYYALPFGKTLLFYNHGHLKKFGQLDTVFASKFRELYGQSKHVYIHSGHHHKDEWNESNLMKMEKHRTLAAKDSYASRHGYQSGRDAKVITYHKLHGEVARITINPDMFK